MLEIDRDGAFNYETHHSNEFNLDKLRQILLDEIEGIKIDNSLNEP